MWRAPRTSYGTLPCVFGRCPLVALADRAYRETAVCGIVGVYRGGGAAAAREPLLAMAAELLHRGPDGTGLYLDGPVAMAATRLAIIDLAGGDQPLSDDEGRYWVVQNGEIYNYVELRAELEGLGHRFATSSDTEVLAHAYAEWGSECLHRLNGDFAFAAWDTLTRELFLARDRFGVRPLFIAQLGGDFCFASEGKALLRHPAARRELDPAALAEFFVTWANPSGRSAFLGISELPPGCSMSVGRRGLESPRRWWDLDFSTKATEPDDVLLEELRGLLDDSVRLRLRADVPVAVYISGGLDSTAIAAFARRHAKDRLSLFGIGFEDERYDESRYQIAAASALDADLTSSFAGADTIADLLPTVVYHAERPTLRTAPAPLLHLAAAVRKSGTKVVLTGEGADELFAGYDIFREDKVRRFCARDPESTVRPLLYARLNEYLGSDLARITPFLARFYGRGLLETDDPLYSHHMRFANGARLVRMLRPDFFERHGANQTPVQGLLERLPADFSSLGSLDRAQYVEVVTFLQGYLLHTQADRMLMAHSVEGRFPYLDHRVAEFAARLPVRLRVLGLREKVGLRRAVEDLLPTEIRVRKKWPYRAPIAGPLLRAEKRNAVLELLEPARVDAAGIFDSKVVAGLATKLAAQHASRASETDEMALVAALSTMLLHESFVAAPSAARAAVPNKVVERTLGSAGAARHVEVVR
jgi:asparagine synthase (glutamine-hydrolysing)